MTNDRIQGDRGTSSQRFTFWLRVSILCVSLAAGAIGAQSAAAVPLPNDFFGVSSIGQLGNEKEVDELLRLGSHNVRNNFEWNRVQPADCNGTATAGIDWSYYDQRVRRAAEHNITIIADLYGTRLPQGCPTDPRQFPVRGGPMYNDWYLEGGYIWQLVQRYGVNGYFWNANPTLPPHPIRVWEVWNEENQALNNWGGKNIQPQAYAQLLIDTAKTIRKAQETQTGQSVAATGTLVLMGGIDTFANDMSVTDYLNTIYASPSGYTGPEFHSAFDGLSFHPYALTGNAGTSIAYIGTARSSLNQKRSALSGGSDSEKTLWITELGWPVGTFTGPNASISDSTQREYLEAALPWIYSHAGENKIEYTGWYAYADWRTECGSWNCWAEVAGLKRSDNSDRPAWCAYMKMIVATCTPPNLWQSDDLGGVTFDDPDVSSWGSGRLDVFVRGTNNNLYHKYFNAGSGWGPWENLGGNLTSGPSAVSWANGRIDVVAGTTNSSVQHWSWDSKDGIWYSDNLGGIITSDPDISSWGTGRLDVFARGTENGLVHRWYNAGSGWGPWEQLGGSLTTSPGAVSWANGRIDVVAGTTNSSVQHWSWDSKDGIWYSDNLGGIITSDPDISSWGTGRLDVFARGTENGLVHRWYNAGSGWGPWEQLGGSALGGAPGAVSWSKNRIDVVARAIDNSVYHAAWEGP